MSNSIIDCANDTPNYIPRGVEQVSPNSGKKTFIPDVASSIIPVVGMVFDTIDHAFEFYKTYALASGFEPRKATTHTNNEVVINKYFLCAKEGYKTFRPVDTLDEKPNNKWIRRAPSKRVGCQAQVRVKLNKDKKYEFYYFKEDHNHTFVQEEDVHLLSAARGVTPMHEDMINKMSKLNIGPVRAFNIMKEVCGGFAKVGATKADFKNFKRDLNVFIGEYDAELMVKRLVRKRDYLPNFTCEYQTGADGKLMSLFWADEDCKRNFYIFGDVVSFDATYRRNKYNMMFVPFTGIDNHNRNVTLGAAILGSETADSYRWLLTVFKKAFGYAPPVFVTDQDPAMKRAIEDVFPETRHRLCMWHIMDKLSAKVGAQICNNTDFKKRLCAIVWTDSLLPAQFESEWDTIMNEFKLTENDWLRYIYGIRESWVPAYYREEQMSGLMRTSSRSESENHFFGQFCNPKSTFVEFISHFDTAVEGQRYEHRKNDHDTRYTSPDIWSDFVLERQAAEVYTRTIFFDVQLEIQHAIHSCTSANFIVLDDFTKFFIKDFGQPCSSFFEVMFRKEDNTAYCTCNRFEQFGLLCSHIFYVLRLVNVREFPRQYILRRWTREAVPNTKPGSILTHNDDALLSDDVNKVVREISYATEYCTNKLLTKFDKLCSFRDYINEFMAIADEAQFDAPRKSRRDRFAELIGGTDVSTATIRVPVGTRHKGCGSHKRIKSKREQAISQAGKKKRQCGKCKEYGHNSRTCGKLYTEPKEVASNKNANGETVVDDTEDTDASEDDDLDSPDEAHIDEE